MEPSGGSNLAADDYRTAFYAQYHRALDMVPARPSDATLALVVRQFRARWDKWLPADRSAACLDIGCGTGEFLYYLRKSGFSRIAGVDLSEQELAIARSLGIEELHLANAVDHLATVEPASLDLVSAFNFFEHLTKAEILQVLPRIHDALRPGGVLIAVTPNGLSPFASATRYWDFSHETGFTPASWRQIARLAGFAEMHFEEYGPLSHSALGIARTLAWRTLNLALTAVSYVEVGRPRDPSRVFTADMKVILRRHS